MQIAHQLLSRSIGQTFTAALYDFTRKTFEWEQMYRIYDYDIPRIIPAGCGFKKVVPGLYEKFSNARILQQIKSNA